MHPWIKAAQDLYSADDLDKLFSIEKEYIGTTKNSKEFFIQTCECGTNYTVNVSTVCPSCRLDLSHVTHRTFNVDGFLNKIYQLSLRKLEDSALDVMFDAFYNLWNRFDLMIEILDKVDITKLTDSVMTGFLVCTFKYSLQLSNYYNFFNKVSQELINRGKPESEIKEMLEGLSSENNYWAHMKLFGASESLTGYNPYK